MEKTLRIANFTYHADAAVLIGRLESEGIKCFLQNEHLVSANPLLSNAVGGIDVTVRESDAERAIAIVEEMEVIKKQASDETGSPEGYKKVLAFCPECESTNTYREKRSFFLSFGAALHVCGNCNNAWKE